MTKADDQSTRDQILDATVEEIAERGWGGVRTRSIAERADVNNALIHYHFSSIEDLKVEAVASTFVSITEAAAESITAETISMGMNGMLREMSAIDPESPQWQVLIQAFLQSAHVPRIRELTVGLLEQYRLAMTARLDLAVAAGELPEATDTEGLALGLMALLDGLGLYAFVNKDYDTARAGRAVIDLITGGDRP